jgi:hypothetical protein
MNLLELQQRANILVDKVNLYEASLTGTELDENQVLNQHTYVDIFCLRPVLKLLFGKDVSDKLSRTLENDIELPLVSSTAPAWNTFFNFFNQEVTSNQHEFIQNIDTYNSSNMLMLDTQQYTLTDRDTAISLGIRYSYGANIGDALVTESQVSNLFNWNTTNDTVVRNNTQTTNRQVPGIVLYYLGNDYNGVYTATIPYSRVLSNINTVNDNNPPLYGAYYDSSDITKSQVGLDMGAECCRIFLPGCNYLGGKLISPQQIWQPDRKVGDDNIGYGYNWQGKAVYHELVFKNRRSGCSNSGVDFIPGLDTIPDNDPQGLAIRVVLAQMKNYYYNRPWFNELNTYRSSTNLADAIYEASKKNIYENQLADFIAVNNNPIINLDTGEYTTHSASDYISVSKTNSILADGTIDFDISFTILDTPGVCLIYCPSCFKIDTSGGDRTVVYIRKANGMIQERINYTENKEYTIRVNINRSTNKLTFYMKNDLSEWDNIVSFTEPNFGNLILGSDTKTWYLNTNAVINLKSCKFTKDNVEYPFIDRVSVGTEPMTDDEFYNSYKLDYDTFADAFGFSK